MKCVTGIRTLEDVEKAVKFLGCRYLPLGGDVLVRMRGMIEDGDSGFRSLYIDTGTDGKSCLYYNYTDEDRSFHEVYNVKDLRTSSFMERHNEVLKNDL